MSDGDKEHAGPREETSAQERRRAFDNGGSTNER